MNLNYLRVFIEVARQGSMLAAATSLSIPNSTVGRHLAKLEEELGANLIVRNTRYLSLTEEGRELFERTSCLMDSLAEVENDILCQSQGLAGKIRISIPNEFGAQWLSECLAKFASTHKNISIDCSTSMVSVDPVRKDMDVSIIYHRGEPDDSSLVMQNLVMAPSVVVGSRSFVEAHGVPEQVSEIAGYPCISTLHALRSNPWHFKDREGNSHAPSINCRYRVDSSNMLISAALSGIGLAIIPLPFCRHHIDKGDLVVIYLDMNPAPLQIAAVFPNRRINARTRSLVDSIRETLLSKVEESCGQARDLSQ